VDEYLEKIHAEVKEKIKQKEMKSQKQVIGPFIKWANKGGLELPKKTPTYLGRINNNMPNLKRDYSAKSDQGKTDWSLLPWRAVEKAAEIMTQAVTPKEEGGKGYGIASWKTVAGGYHRYSAALIRHFIRRFVYDEIIDEESGLPHMAHAICNCMFLCERDLENENSELSEEERERFFERDI